MNKITVNHTSIIISNYNLGDNLYLEKMLSIWNDSYFRYDTKGFQYDPELKQLLIPRGLDLSYLEKSFNANIEIDYKPDPYEPASFRLKTEPRDDIQRKSISYLLGEIPFNYTKKYSQLSLNLQTSFGKTYCVIAALTFMKVKSLIITHNNAIKKQWHDSLLSMTDLDDSYICNIEGSSVIELILKSKTLKYKVYMVNHRTLQVYGEKNGWDKISNLFKKIAIGVKVIDEAHIEFYNTLKIDFYTNTKKTFYLTANFERSEHKDNKLFNLCFKNIAKYGIETKDDKRKHIVYISVIFNSKPTLDIQASIKGLHGFDRNKYIDYQMRNGMIHDVILYLLNYFNDKEGKTLVLSSKIESSKIIADYIRSNYTNKSIAIYNSEVSDNDKLIALTSDIISSTPKSTGTGSDIPGLRILIMTEPYSSAITANQISGRLREYSSSEYTFYIELVDRGFGRVYDMYKKRLKHFKTKCVKILELKYNNERVD